MLKAIRKTKAAGSTKNHTEAKADETFEEERWFLFAERPMGQHKGQPWLWEEAYSRNAQARSENQESREGQVM
jgi:hypothetical protein